uniref:Uncharacterized protein n=1 Tax=Setaria digitata TaxID=48799 RepID=A0A915Q878_9BILA
MISQLQEKFCLGNSVLTPYWLPSRDSIGQRCHILLKNRYLKLDRLEREMNSLLLLCVIQHSQPLTDHQRQYCNQSLFQRVHELREKDGSPSLDQCFQGNKRFERQCGTLRQCCNAYDRMSETGLNGISFSFLQNHYKIFTTLTIEALVVRGSRCKSLVKRSLIAKQKETILRDIRSAAKKCKEGSNVTAPFDETNNSRGFSTLITFTDQVDTDDSMKSAFQNSPHGGWYTALKTKLNKETENSLYQRDNFTTDKKDRTADEIEKTKTKEYMFPDEIENWDNAEYRKDIEEYKMWKMQRNLNLNYTTAEKSLDHCKVHWNQTNQLPLSTSILLQMGDYCLGQDDNSLNELYELVIERRNKLHKCLLNEHQKEIQKSPNCSRKFTNRPFISLDKLQMAKNRADCLAEVNAIQFQCEQLRECCPDFYRCRDETFDAKAELRIALLTIQLITRNYDCLVSKITTN